MFTANVYLPGHVAPYFDRCLDSYPQTVFTDLSSACRLLSREKEERERERERERKKKNERKLDSFSNVRKYKKYLKKERKKKKDKKKAGQSQ